MSASEEQPLLGPNPRLDQRIFIPAPPSRQISNLRRSLPRNVSRDQFPQDVHNIQSTQRTRLSAAWQLRLAIFTILSSVVLERISFYGLTGNLVLFLNKNPFLWESYNAMNAMFLFFGITYITSLIGGWIADSCLGRFKFMLLAFVIYGLGYALLPCVALNSDENASTELLPGICQQSNSTATANNLFEEKCAWLIILTLIIVGIGAGLLKSSIVPFGSEQLSRSSQQTQLSFFNWFYWCVNFGSFVGLGGVTYIQQQKSFKIGYIIGAATLGMSCIIFIMGRCFYVCRVPDGSMLTNIFRIIREAWKRNKQLQRLRSLHQKSASEGHGHIESTHEEKIGFLDHAKHRYGGSFHNSLVDDVKKLGVVLLVFAVLIPYWIVYFQMQTSFLFQGLHMRLDISSVPFTPIENNSKLVNNSKPVDNTKPEIVAAWFTLFDACFVILLLPLFDRVIYPRMARAGHPFTFTKRILLGMFFAMLAMIVAAIVEHFRLNSFWPYPDFPCQSRGINQTIGNTVYQAADMSIVWQIPQYALIGVSEVFASVASLQFAVTVAPKSMKAVITGLYYFFSGVGSLLGTAIISTLSYSNTWFNSQDYGNINCRLPCNDSGHSNVTVYSDSDSCHLDYYFYLLAGVELLAMILFLIVANKFGLNVDQLVQTGPSREDNKGKQLERPGANSR
ncbi:solute carrier family 15 member 4 isoform X2 [Biomphalaria glabrata]|nr:solute carrier family 15 member 4 isoform X2 [Biomphalaria glabrata]